MFILNIACPGRVKTPACYDSDEKSYKMKSENRFIGGNMSKQDAGVVIERVYNAPVDKVWKYWTKPDMVKKWWGPEGFTAPSIKINLRVGGKYVFAMHGPKDSEWDKDIYSAGVYKEIVPNKKLKVTDYFSDENGNQLEPAAYGEDPDFPRESTVTVLFKEYEKCRTKLSIQYPTVNYCINCYIFC